MKICPSCQNHMEDDALFCNNCGQRVESTTQAGNVAGQQAYQQPYQQQPYQQQPYQQQPYQQQAYQQQAYQQQPYQQPHQDNFEAARQAVGHSLDTVGGYSEFDGGLLQLIGWNLLGILLTGITCGIAFPWAYCMVLRWETNHTVINGRRLAFDGTGGQLFGKYILWVLLTIVTCGIYGLWLGIKMKQWVVSHTHFAN